MLTLVMALVCWTKVMVDCLGNPETTVEYGLRAQMLIPVWGTCLDPDTQTYYTCVLRYNRSAMIEFVRVPHINDAATDQCIAMDVETLMPTPPVDAVTFFPGDAVAYDAAGNHSPCP